MNIIIAFISVRCILGRCLKLRDDVFDVWQVYICVYLAFLMKKKMDEVLAFSLCFLCHIQYLLLPYT